jgi:hypothetical protein
MAKVDILHSKRQHHVFYNVDQAVGKNCPNQRDDVLLVQYLLKNAVNAFPAIFKWSLLNYPVDGRWDRNWIGLLRAYIDAHAAIGNKMVSDDRVDQVVGGQVTGPLHHMQLVIVVLNLQYGDLRPNDFPRIAQVGDCPGELQPLLKWEVLANPARRTP